MESKNVCYPEKLSAFMQRWLYSSANNAECCCLKVGRGERGGGGEEGQCAKEGMGMVPLLLLQHK